MARTRAGSLPVEGFGEGFVQVTRMRAGEVLPEAGSSSSLSTFLHCVFPVHSRPELPQPAALEIARGDNILGASQPLNSPALGFSKEGKFDVISSLVVSQGPIAFNCNCRLRKWNGGT